MAEKSKHIAALEKKIAFLEKELQASLTREADKDCLLRDSPDILYRTNLEGFVTYISPAVTKLCGYTVEEATGMHMANEVYVNPEIRESFLDALQKHGRVDNFVNPLRHKDGSIWWGAANAHLYFDDKGEIAGVEGVVRDVTELKAIEEELISLNATLEKKIKDRTDELRRLNEYLVLSEEKTRNYFASALHDTIAQNLTFSLTEIKNMTHSDLPINRENIFRIEELLETAMAEIRSIIYELRPPIINDFEIDIALESLIDGYNENHNCRIDFINQRNDVLSTPQAVKLALYRSTKELIINMIKHSKTKKAGIQLSNNAHSISLTVEDHGIGFDTNRLKTPNLKTFGLYSLSERISNLGGQFEIFSTPGSGTRVEITIPIRSNEDR